MTKGIPKAKVSSWFNKLNKSLKGSRTFSASGGRQKMSTVQPENEDELNRLYNGASKVKDGGKGGGASTSKTLMPYQYPEQVPGPGAYNMAQSLIKPTYNRRIESKAPNPSPNQGGSKKTDFANPMSIDDFEKAFEFVGNGSYLNHRQKYRSQSAPSTRRDNPNPERIRYHKAAYNPIIDLDKAPSDALLGRWQSVHMTSYKWTGQKKFI